MKHYSVCSLIAGCLLLLGAAAAQTPAGSALPRLVRFSGTAKDTGGSSVTGVTGITFALYAEQTGGAPLWSETQSVQAGPDGRYTVLLGAAKSEGPPASLSRFTPSKPAARRCGAVSYTHLDVYKRQGCGRRRHHPWPAELAGHRQGHGHGGQELPAADFRGIRLR